ncbi:hypothetical protein HY571_00725 [Candidatus Micrarchaeota archaeon]|nr:hypothetical protein [Candidatus Micrarchaeota archaeon]
MNNLNKRKGASEWSSIYLLIVVVIAMILLITLIKPVLKQAGQAAVAGGQEAGAYAAVGAVLFRKFTGK